MSQVNEKVLGNRIAKEIPPEEITQEENKQRTGKKTPMAHKHIKNVQLTNLGKCDNIINTFKILFLNISF